MKIIQVADLHIGSEAKVETLKFKINKIFNSVKGKIAKDEELIFCVCGDIVDRGNDTMYNYAEEIFNHIKQCFYEYKLNFEFVPGNHDLCNENFEAYDKFIAKFIMSSYAYNNGVNTHLREYSSINLVLSNSIHHRDKTYGKLDVESIESSLNEKPTLLVIHHTLLSENDGDISSIRNSYKIMDLVERKKVIAILHGHTHGYKDIKIGGKCRIIGVGPMFKEVADINNQFNLVDLNGYHIQMITNYRYSADLDEYTPITVHTENINSFYYGSSVKEVYDEVTDDTKRYNCIHNLKINISSEYSNFEKDIYTYFSDTISVAKDWQSKTVPQTLYYNHGKYMQSEGVWGIDYVIDELKNKSTSSRAIIPLINFKDVANSGDRFLPSLDIIQFGFADDEKKKIFVTIYLRALEVNHFLRINLCEIYLMLKNIKDEIRSIKNIDLAILAFKAQYKEKYGCFRKAEIDSITEAKLTGLLLSKNYQQIINLLKEKLELNETVVQWVGLKYLQSALIEAVESKSCSKILLETISCVLEQLEILKIEREKTSNYSEIEKTEQLVAQAINNLIDGFEKERGVKE
jgi:thymidylate synthase/metallophosphoesterase superfamily enzyme